MRLEYPPAPPAPVERTFGGVTVADPYAWLEEDSAAALAWQAEQDRLAADYLAALPGFAAHAALLAQVAPAHEVAAPRHGGGRWFRVRAAADGGGEVIEVAATPAGPGRVAVDPSAGPALFSWLSPSPDGRALAFACADGGAGEESLTVVDVATGAVIAANMPPGRGGAPAWLADGRTFCFRADPSAGAGSGSAIYRHTLGDPPPTRPEPVALGHPLAWPVATGGGRWVLAVADHLAPRPEAILDVGAGAWRPFLAGMNASFRGVVAGDRFVAITDDGAPRGRVVAIPLATPRDRGTWREVLPEGDGVLASLVAVGERLLLVELVDTYARLRVLTAGGAVEGEIPLPGRGAVSTVSAAAVAIAFMECVAVGAGDEVVFVFSSLTSAPALYRADLARRTCSPLTAPAVRLDAVAEDRSAVSADGTRVPYRVVRRRDIRAAAPLPTVISVFGGFNVALLPAWPSPPLAAWVAAGGALVIAHVRGGGELGLDWWRGGRRDRRQRAFDDLHAVAEDLVSRGAATPARLGVHGVSSGAQVAAAAAVQRPELYGAVVAQLPLTDQLALERDPVSLMVASVEDGDPRDPAMAPLLCAWSPYHNVREGVAYPAMLLDCSAADPRCPPWHGRKLAARLQAASSSGRPVLVRVRPSSGHRTVGAAARERQHAEQLAFLAAALGLQP
jgi:prolyl oligopeptidase